jgi:hypothetical protein
MNKASGQAAPVIARRRQRIGLVSSAVPLILGGGRFIVEWLEHHLRNDGHDVETIFIPTADNPDTILRQMAAFRLIELDRHFDTVITFRPPSHLVRHRRKVCWFIHHIRIFYDLWNTDYNHLPDTAQTRALRKTVHRQAFHKQPHRRGPRESLQRPRLTNSVSAYSRPFAVSGICLS